MVNKLTKKAIISISKNIAMYGAEMSKLREKIDAIDEKYRKMAEEARKDLALEYSSLEAEQEIWQSSLSRYDSEDVNEVLGEFNATTTSDTVESFEEAEAETAAEEEPEQVVDNLFAENNTSDSSSNHDDKKIVVKNEEVNETTDPASSAQQDINDIWPEYDSVAEANEYENTSDNKDAAEPEPDTEINMDMAEDGFPEFPEEW